DTLCFVTPQGKSCGADRDEQRIASEWAFGGQAHRLSLDKTQVAQSCRYRIIGTGVEDLFDGGPAVHSKVGQAQGDHAKRAKLMRISRNCTLGSEFTLWQIDAPMRQLNLPASIAHRDRATQCRARRSRRWDSERYSRPVSAGLAPRVGRQRTTVPFHQPRPARAQPGCETRPGV